jgi:pyruvate-formate lyase-activating enzyme
MTAKQPDQSVPPGFRERAKRLLARGAAAGRRAVHPRALMRDFARRQWVSRAFRDFIPTDGNRVAMVSSLTTHLGVILSRFKERAVSEVKGREFAEYLLYVCAVFDDGKVRHKDLKLRSYVDVSIQVKALRIFVGYLSAGRRPGPRSSPTAVTELLLKHFPESRLALLVHADILLESGEVEAALEAVQKALRIQAVCITAQQLLMRAYRAKRDAGSTDDALKIVDYDLKDKFCPMPFTYLSTGWKGSAHLCSCPGWVPFPVGNVLEAEGPDEVWNSEAAVEIRRSILDGDFSYCSRTLCYPISAQKLPRRDEIDDPVMRGYIDNHTTTLPEPPHVVELNYDATCNLACPSCRTEIITAKADEQDTYARATDRVILPLLKGAKGLYLSGGGEALASKHYRSILSRLNRAEYPNLSIHLLTNGQLVTPQRWGLLPHLSEMVGVLSVSIDAAQAETYEKLRRPGKWEPLLANLEFVAELRRSGRLRSLCINFVVQKDNFRQMLDFTELGKRLGADCVWFQRVVNYGAYDQETFAEVDVFSPDHPEHAELLAILRNPILKGPTINGDAFMYLLPEVVASDERMEYLYNDWTKLIML